MQYIEEDPRPLPKPTGEVDISDDIRVVCPPGGMIVFSAAHLHSSVPNTSGKTRFSVDFRTVNTNDLIRKGGAANIDSRCSGTVLNEFRQIGDVSPLPDDIVSLYQDGTEHVGNAVFDGRS
jgi:hypothetical protein